MKFRQDFLLASRTNLFAYLTSGSAPKYFPGAAFLAGAVITLISLLLAMRTLASYVHKTTIVPNQDTVEKEAILK